MNPGRMNSINQSVADIASGLYALCVTGHISSKHVDSVLDGLGLETDWGYDTILVIMDPSTGHERHITFR